MFDTRSVEKNPPRPTCSPHAWQHRAAGEQCKWKSCRHTLCSASSPPSPGELSRCDNSFSRPKYSYTGHSCTQPAPAESCSDPDKGGAVVVVIAAVPVCIVTAASSWISLHDESSSRMLRRSAPKITKNRILCRVGKKNILNRYSTTNEIC